MAIICSGFGGHSAAVRLAAVGVPILEEVTAVFDGPVTQMQGLTISSITRKVVVARRPSGSAGGGRPG